MEHSCSQFRFLFLFLLCGILLPCMAISLESVAANVTDRLALLDFKKHITQDPLRIMSTWNDSLHLCSWLGITCSSSNERVVILKLDSRNLSGSIPPSIGNLSFLTGLSLMHNDFHGSIPEELGRLAQLQHLNLSYNSLVGQIPANLSHCKELTIFKASENKLSGPIPQQFGSLFKLLTLGIQKNYLSGSIPASMGNLSSLRFLDLGSNNLQGSIPSELGLLRRLEFFQVSVNKLSGTVPSLIYNISSIYFFCIASNYLEGNLPPNVGLTLPNLQDFWVDMNNFTGHVPISLPNASNLLSFDFSLNDLTGNIPSNLGSLQGLWRLSFESNRLGSGKVGDLNFLTSLANCSKLEILALGWNGFGGLLPVSIANFSTSLRAMGLNSNKIHGSIPNDIGNLVNLASLELDSNYFTGSVPENIGMLQKLGYLYMGMNKFSGLIPSSLGNLSLLYGLLLDRNRLEGRIPPTLGNCKRLTELFLSYNYLNGTIPKEVIGLSPLSVVLDMSHNSLTGSLPLEVGNLINLNELDVSYNKLYSEIPRSLGNCLVLEQLLMGSNFLHGSIPESLKALRSLEKIDFSRNNFSGNIPEFLGELVFLKKLNLSFNNLEGPMPTGRIFSNANAISVQGNDYLCGGIVELHLPACNQNATRPSRKFLAHKIIVPTSVAIILSILFCCLATYYAIKNSRKGLLTASSTLNGKLSISYAELYRSTNGFSEDNVIGSGSFGSVYKGVLESDGAIVAVKVLNLQILGAFRSFMDECKALRSIRHRNLLKVITVCSRVDHQGNDFKAMVFEFLSNGNLDQWLHPRDGEQRQVKSLSIIQRLNIAIHVACALEYLHHHCQTPIVHCDLKPSNVLLDDDMTAHVCDFGLATFLFEEPNKNSNSQTLSAMLKGSVGYIPPEYGFGGQVSTLGDVYSYGILLLEMFTCKRPTDDAFNDRQSIHDFVAMALPERALDIVDRVLLSKEETSYVNEVPIEGRGIINDDFETNNRSGMVECLVSVLGIGLACSDLIPTERMPMNVVVNKLHTIRESFFGFRNRNKRRTIIA